MKPTRFTLLTRPGCHLCEEFEAELMAAFGERVEVEAVHVDAHPEWQAAYGLSIPVLLTAAGDFVCAVEVDVEAVTAKLA